MVSSKRAAAVAALLGTLSCATVARVPAAGSKPEVRLLDGTVVSWPSLLAARGNTLVVFATLWCEICRRERPEVEAWARAHREPTRSVYVFSGGELPKMLEQVRALQLDTTALTIVVDADGRLADHYAVESTPTLLLLGANGRVLSTRHRFKSLDLD